MASAVEIEDETVVALRAALGRTIDSHEVGAFLRAVGVKDVNGDVTDRKKFPPSSEFVNYRPHGVSLCFENGSWTRCIVTREASTVTASSRVRYRAASL